MTVYTVYVIRHKDSKVGKDVYFGRTLLQPLYKVLLNIKLLAEERGSRNESGTEFFKRMQAVGLENWKIVPLAGARSYDEAKDLWKMSREMLNADLNKLLRPSRERRRRRRRRI